MKHYAVIFSPEAEEQLAELYRYIAATSSTDIAFRYTNAIVACCEDLRTFPNRGVNRDDVRPGLRITHHKGRTVIAYAIDDNRVSIIGIYYGGRDYEAILQLDEED